MFRKKSSIKFIISFALVCVAGIYCKKIEKGFLSDRIYYQQNPLITGQGSVTVSAPIQSDGSTNPLTVIIKAITDASGANVDSMLLKKDSIPGFSGAITYEDSTIDLLNKKITYTTAAPLSVSLIGGRIQLTPATIFVTPGTYNMAVEVSNVRGTKYLPQACQIIIGAKTSNDTVQAGSYAGYVDSNNRYNGTLIAAPIVSVAYYPTSYNKIVFKWIDKNGLVFNAKKYGVQNRVGRWRFKQFDPYFPEVLTDTAVEYQFPKVPNVFPIFQNPGLNGIIPRGDFGVFFVIPKAANQSGYGFFTFFDVAFYSQGLYVVTIQQPDIVFNP
jgi:hypothetical protein